MAHTYDTKANLARGRNAAGRDLTYNCGAGATLLVLCIAVDGLTARTGGAPTYNGVAMIQADQNRYYASSGETISELWYLLGPLTGSPLTIHIPDNNNVYFTAEASSYKAAAGKTSALRVASGASGSSTNPTGPTHTGLNAGDVIVACVGNGATTWAPSGRTGVQLYDIDDGSYGDGAQYYIKVDANDQAMAWTFGTSSTWGLCSAVFMEAAASYSESVSLGSASGISDTRLTGMVPAASLPGAAALTPSGIKDGFGAAALAGEAALIPAGGLSPEGEHSLPVSAAVTEAADLAVLRELGLVCQAGISLGAALSIQSSMSLSGNAAVGEGSGGSGLFSGLGIPGAGALAGDGIVAAARSLGLTGLAGLPVAARADLLTAMGLPGTAALDQVASLLAAQALTLAGLGALNADGTIETGGSEYQEGISLAAVAAAVKTALLDILASQTLPGAGGISTGAIVQATAGAVLAAGGALNSANILARLGSVSLPVVSDLGAVAELGIMRTCSLAGVSSLTMVRQLDCAGLLMMESVSAFAPFFGPRVVRGYRLALIINALKIDLNFE